MAHFRSDSVGHVDAAGEAALPARQHQMFGFRDASSTKYREHVQETKVLSRMMLLAQVSPMVLMWQMVNAGRTQMRRTPAFAGAAARPVLHGEEADESAQEREHEHAQGVLCSD